MNLAIVIQAAHDDKVRITLKIDGHDWGVKSEQKFLQA